MGGAINILKYESNDVDVFEFTETGLQVTSLYRYVFIGKNDVDSDPFEITVKAGILPQQARPPELNWGLNHEFENGA